MKIEKNNVMKRTLAVILGIILIGGNLFAQDKTARDYKIEGAEAYSAKDYAKALEAFENAIALYEKSGEIDTALYFNAGVCAYKVDNYEKAESLFETSVNLVYKPCKAMLFRTNSLRKLERYDEMEKVADKGVASCPKSADKFNDILFGYYMKEGLELYNDAAKVQADAVTYIESDNEKYKQKMARAKEGYQQAMPYLKKANNLDPANQSVSKAMQAAKQMLNTEY